MRKLSRETQLLDVWAFSVCDGIVHFVSLSVFHIWMRRETRALRASSARRRGLRATYSCAYAYLPGKLVHVAFDFYKLNVLFKK